MSERAHPDDPDFKNRIEIRYFRGLLPLPRLRKNPYREAFFWRYAQVSRLCKTKDVLDIPCGMGWGTSLIRNCKRLFGVDISLSAVQEARHRYGSHARFLQGSMHAIPFRDQSLDTVVCLEGIEHVPEPVAKAFLREAARVLRPAGRLCLSSPCCSTGEHSGNPYHIKEYSQEETQALLIPHFNILDVTTRQVGILSVSYFFAERRPLSL